VFDSRNAGKPGDTDHITDFNAAEGDAIDVHSILTGFDPASSVLSDFVQLSESGGNTVLKIDVNGAAGGAHFITLAVLDGVTGLDAATLVANHNLVLS
jgi:hypothetical protein